MAPSEFSPGGGAPRRLPDLPNEVLFTIFRHLIAPEPSDRPVAMIAGTSQPIWPEYHTGRRDLRNLRLVSRHFKAVVDPLLHRFVFVSGPKNMCMLLTQLALQPDLRRAVRVISMHFPIRADDMANVWSGARLPSPDNMPTHTPALQLDSVARQLLPWLDARSDRGNFDLHALYAFLCLAHRLESLHLWFCDLGAHTPRPSAWNWFANPAALPLKHGYRFPPELGAFSTDQWPLPAANHWPPPALRSVLLEYGPFKGGNFVSITRHHRAAADSVFPPHPRPQMPLLPAPRPAGAGSFTTPTRETLTTPSQAGMVFHIADFFDFYYTPARRTDSYRPDLSALSSLTLYTQLNEQMFGPAPPSRSERQPRDQPWEYFPRARWGPLVLQLAADADTMFLTAAGRKAWGGLARCLRRVRDAVYRDGGDNDSNGHGDGNGNGNGGALLEAVHLPLRIDNELAERLYGPRRRVVGLCALRSVREVTVTIDGLVRSPWLFDAAASREREGPLTPEQARVEKWGNAKGRRAVRQMVRGLPPQVERLNLIEWFSSYGFPHAPDADGSDGDALGERRRVVPILRGLAWAFEEARPSLRRVELLLHRPWPVQGPADALGDGIELEKVVQEYEARGITLAIRGPWE